MKQADYIIRPFKGEDAEKVRSIIRDIFVEFNLIETPIDFKNGKLWVYESVGEKEVVGSLGLLPLDIDKAEIRYIYLKPEKRGLGLGKKGVEFLLSYAQKNKFSILNLETSSSFNSAIKLYEKYGFYEINKCNKTSQCDRQYELRLGNG